MARTLASTTLAAAVAKADKQFLLSSVAGLAVGNLLFTGREAMLVNEIVGTRVSVQRGYNGAPQDHPTGQKVWFGPGSDFYGHRKTGAADANAELVLPRIVLPEGVIQDVKGGQWVDVQDDPRKADKKPVYNYAASGAIEIAAGVHKLNGAGALAMTLADPSADDEGTVIRILTTTAQAHTVTLAGGLAGAGAAADVGTFTAAIGNGVSLVAIGGKWYLDGPVSGVTFA